MNITAYLQQRQYGGLGRKRTSNKPIEEFVEGKVTTKFVNKACAIPGRSRSTFVMEFSPDGTKVASTHGDHSVRVTEIATGKCLKTLTGHPRTPWCLAYHPSSTHILASGCLNGQVRIWDLYGQGCEVWQTENTTVIASLTFHPIDHVLVIAAGNTLYFWDWSKPEPFAKCSTAYEYERIRWVKFDNLGNYLYTGISNNTSIHRESVASTATTSEERPSGRPSRLGSLYNNIVNCFHEYQRDRLVHQLNPHPHWRPATQSQLRTGNDPYDSGGYPPTARERARSPLTVPGTSDTNPESVHSMVRQNELLMGSYSDLLAERSRVYNSRQGQNPVLPGLREMIGNSSARTQNLNTEFLINPSSDPLLSGVPSQSELIGLTSVEPERVPLLEEDGEQGSSMATATVIRGLNSPPPDLRRSSLDESLLLHEDNLLREIQDSNYGRSGLENSAIRRVETRSVLDSAISSESPLVRLGDKSTYNVGASVTCDNNSQSSRSAPLSSCETAKSRSTGMSYQKPQSTSQTFRSIRDRLQTSIPLSLDSQPGVCGGPVRVVSSRETGAPQVTVITGTDLGAQSSIVNTRQEYNNVIYPTGTNSESAGNQHGGFGRFLVSRLVDGQNTEQNVTNSNCDNVGTGDQLRPSSQSTSAPESNSRQSNAARSHSSLFQSTYPRASTASSVSSYRLYSSDSGSRYRPLSTRSHPYHWPCRPSASHLPLMGPYLESRGIRSGSYRSLSDQSPATRSSESVSYVPARPSYTSTVLGTAQQTQTATRDSQTSSDTESEISSHLTHSGAYFVPIRSDASRMGSSTSSCSTSSADRSSYPAVSSVENLTESTGRQSSRSSSQSQGQEVELTVDQNDNYSASQMPNANIVNRSEIRHETQDDNNNSIHIVQPVPNIHQQVSLPGIRPSVQSMNSGLYTCMSAEPSPVSVRQSGVAPPSTVTVLPTSIASVSSVSGLPTSVIPTSSVALTSSAQPSNQDYVSLRNTFFSMTSQIEREMSDLNRRINALRDSFNESLLALRQDRHRYECFGSMLTETASSLPLIPTGLESAEEAPVPPEITITQPGEAEEREQAVNTAADQPAPAALTQPLTLLESSLRSHRWNRQNANIQESASAQDVTGSERELNQGDTHSWRSLHRHYLHPHYSSSILDETINRPNNAIQSAINRAIAGAFMGTGEAAVANNIINQTHRIQYWDFSHCDIPDITTSTENILVPHCKLHNSASCDISQDCSLLATFVPSHQGFPDDNILTVYSLRPEIRGQCLFTKSFGPNAISISISPKNNHVLVGLAAKRLSWVFTSDQLVAQIYRLEKEGAGEKSMKHVKDVMHSCNMGIRSHVSGNSARWLPRAGQGIVYGTNRGDLHLCRPGVKVIVEKTDKPDTKRSTEYTDSTGNIRRCLLGRVPWMNYSSPDRISTSTQTHGVRRTTSTQTEQDEADNVIWL